MEYLFVDFLYLFGHSFQSGHNCNSNENSIVVGRSYNKIEVAAKMLNFNDKKFRKQI